MPTLFTPKSVTWRPMKITSDEDALAKLREMLGDAQYGISGHNVPNGADYYRCSACGAQTRTLGHAAVAGFTWEVEHHPDCALVMLVDWFHQTRPTNEI